MVYKLENYKYKIFIKMIFLLEASNGKSYPYKISDNNLLIEVPYVDQHCELILKYHIATVILTKKIN